MKSSAAVVTMEQVKTGLKTATVTAREEQALRMRYGATVSKSANLPTAYGDNEDLADELLVMEMSLLKSLKAHQGKMATKATAPARSASKSKIVSALKGKK
jgi:hypothetical protein